jgi:hypothetical protein
MKKYKAMVIVGGTTITTVVYAENPTFAYKLMQKLFGEGNVITTPIQI